MAKQDFLTLYNYFRSSSSHRVRIALELKGLDWNYLAVHLVKNGGEQNREEFRKLSPRGEVPVLVHGKNVLTQSLAIIFYLDKIHPVPALFPSDPFQLGKCLEWCEMINSGIQPLQNLMVLQQIEKRFKASGEEKVSWAKFFIERGLQALEDQWAGIKTTFTLGETPMAPEIFLIPQIFSARRFGVDLSLYPTLMGIESACESLPSFRAAAPEQQPDFQGTP